MQLDGFVGSSYVSQSSVADGEELINWYVERLESPGATVRMALYPTPGVTQLVAAGSGPGRAHFYDSGTAREFAVIYTTLYEISANGSTLTSRGSVALDANPATISSNGDGGRQLFITSGGNGYNFNLSTNTLTQIAALNGKATQGAHLDGYFLALDANTSTMYLSALLDGTTWATGTDFAQRSIAPDPWVALKVWGRYLLLLGGQTSEVWYNTGASFPFTPHPSGLISYGATAAFSVVSAGTDIMWLGSQAGVGGVQVLRMSGFTPENVASQPFQTIVGDYSTKSDALADVYHERGHTFYVLSFPDEDVTWSWDIQTRLWHRRGTWTSADNSYGAIRPRWHSYAHGEHRMLDSTTGAVYRQSAILSSDADGLPIRRLRRAPALVVDNSRVFYHSFEVDVESGLGLATGQGSNPLIMMRFSNDGGKTWSNEYMRSAGAIGEYGQRARWTRTGVARRRVFEIVVTDPIPFRILGAWINAAREAGAQAPQQGGA